MEICPDYEPFSLKFIFQWTIAIFLQRSQACFCSMIFIYCASPQLSLHSPSSMPLHASLTLILSLQYPCEIDEVEGRRLWGIPQRGLWSKWSPLSTVNRLLRHLLTSTLSKPLALLYLLIAHNNWRGKKLTGMLSHSTYLSCKLPEHVLEVFVHVILRYLFLRKQKPGPAGEALLWLPNFPSSYLQKPLTASYTLPSLNAIFLLSISWLSPFP